MKLTNRINDEIKIGNHSVTELAEQYGTPLYIYDEATIRRQCRRIKGLCNLDNFRVRYSAKANTSVALLKIIREEGLLVDAMSLGEVLLAKEAGFTADEILFVSNNVGEEIFKALIEQKIPVCLDSTVQLETYCALHPGSEVSIRLNLGPGDGHHAKTITAGKVKFGIEPSLLECAHEIAEKYNVTITGVMAHIGSLFLRAHNFQQTVLQLLDLAKFYPKLKFIDFGGGFGIAYHREKEKDFPVEEYAPEFTETLLKWMDEHSKELDFFIEPGRFLVAESGVCLCRVNSVKINSGIKFVGTDLGSNFLLRPELYDAYHEIVHATKTSDKMETVTVVGNICESGDVLGKDRELPATSKDDLLIVRDTGAYGFSMASNYNSMLRPAEVLVEESGNIRLIRKREVIEDLVRNQIY